jgi:hypothetical protein
MPANPPVSFQQMAQSGGNPAAGGYPYQIRASDLDKNFVYATLDADASLIETTTGTGGHPARKLKIPAVPGSGTHVLGAVGGALTWIATEEC